MLPVVGFISRVRSPHIPETDTKKLSTVGWNAAPTVGRRQFFFQFYFTMCRVRRA